MGRIGRRVRLVTRPNAARPGYDAKWQRMRAKHLQANPLCALCLKAGRRQRGSYVGHIVPHNGDPALFWNTANWQTVCFHHKTVRR